MAKPGTLYTIGYQALPPARLAALAAHLDATVIDCRASPVSRSHGYGRRQLEALLGPRYEPRGHQLGGRRAGVSHTTAAGIAVLRADLAAGRNLMLMCMESAPGECHRHSDICAPHFPDALHIYEREIVTARALQTCLDDANEDADYPIAAFLPL